MTKTLSLAVALTLLAGLSQLQAGERSELKATTERFRSVQIVRDLAAFNILSLSSQKEGAWIVMSIYESGGNLRLEGSTAVDQVWGKWKRLELLSGAAPPEGRYLWQEPHRNYDFDRSKSIYDLSSVFRGYDVTVICRFFDKKTGADQFMPATAIPDDWKTLVKPAYEHHVRHWADFADRDPDGLRKMASGENPFVALTALRHLLSRPSTLEETDRFVELARSLPKYRQAVLTYWLLQRNGGKAPETVLKAVRRAKNGAELTGIALGIESWTATQGRNGFSAPSAKNARDKVIERWRDFDRATASHEPWKLWYAIVIAPGIPEAAATEAKTNK